VVVFNILGANANAVKELVMTGMLLVTRGILLRLADVQTFTASDRCVGDVRTFVKRKGSFYRRRNHLPQCRRRVSGGTEVPVTMMP
jgi:hypothetical protein